MSIFKTTLSLESPKSSSAPIKLNSTINNDLTDNVTMGKVTLNSIDMIDINPESNGARGSYLYVKSSSSNPKHTAIKIYADPETQPITLYVGEYALIPVSASQAPLMAMTTHGSAELEYFHGSRGEEIGESVLIHYKNTTSGKWEYFIMDAITGIAGPVVEPIIGDNSLWISPQYHIVNHKGYIIRYTNSTTQDLMYVFINRRGLIINEVTGNPTYNYTVWTGDGIATLLTWIDEGVGYAVHFDGDSYTEHEFNNTTDIYVDDQWSECTSDGTFPVYIEGTGDIESIFLIKGANKTLIKTTDFGNNGEYANAYVYTHGNFIAVETKTDQNKLETLEIFNASGTPLKSVDFNGMTINLTDFYFYGSGKLQIVYSTNTELIFLNYNQLTGKLNGDDLGWNSTTTQQYEVVCDNYTTNQSVEYRPESVAIIIASDINIDTNYFLNKGSGTLKVSYIINNDLEPRTYIVPSSENNYHASNYSWNHMQASINDFVLFSSNDRDNGPITATRFTSNAEPTKFVLIPANSNYIIDGQESNNYIESRIFGDYRFIGVKKLTGNFRDFIVYDSKILDKVSNITDNYADMREFNSLAIIDTDQEKNWYFNTSTKKWALFPGTILGWDSPGSEGSQFPVDQGKIILFGESNNGQTLFARAITRGVASSEKELLKNIDTSESYWVLSTETLALSYLENAENSKWKVRVFDLNLNLLYEIDTQKTYAYGSTSYGKVNFNVFTNTSNVGTPPITFYNFNKLLNVKTIDYPMSNLDYVFNNWAWW